MVVAVQHGADIPSRTAVCLCAMQAKLEALHNGVVDIEHKVSAHADAYAAARIMFEMAHVSLRQFRLCSTSIAPL
jgi:hypothetical protein